MSTLYSEEQLKKLILYCPGENTNYPSPDVMVDEHGNKLYAYVTLIMLGDRYIPGAIVLAHSIKRLDSQADLVVLVTPDVSEDGKRLLSTFFDRVILVDPVRIPNWRVKNQPSRKYLDYVFTKFHLFDLVQYKKVLMIDADALILKYPDHLFSLNAPAGSLLEDKNQFLLYDKNGNYILPSDNKIKWYKIFCECCGHGKVIPKEYTDRVATNPKNSGIGASIVLLAPKKGEFQSIIKDVKEGKMKYLVENKFVWPEQQYLTLRYSGKWTSFNPRFYGLQGYPHWKVLFSLQYAGDKPWFMLSKTDISIRTKYPDFILWHKFYSEILERFPLFKTNKVLDEANEIHQFFIVKIHQERNFLSRYTLNRTPEETKSLIKKLLNIKKVNDEQLDMYYLDDKLSYRPYKLKPMFPNINDYDYLEPIKKLTKNFPDTNYYNSLLDKLNEINIQNNKPLNIINNLNNMDIEDIDNIMLQYIKCKTSCFIISVWPVAFDIMDQIVDELGKNGNIYYVKNISLSYDGLQNLLFWMYDEFSFQQRKVFISKKMEYIEAKKHENNNIGVIIFDNVKNVKISGQASEFKKYIRNFVLKLLNSKSKQNELRGNDVIHINDHFYQTVNYSELLLNNNSINLLNKQEIQLTNTSYMYKQAHFKLQTFIKFLYNNLSPLEISKIITIGGLILYAYGIRPSTDIDSIMTKPLSPELEQLMNDNFGNESTKFEFADMGIEGKYWRESWTLKNKQIFDAFGIKSNADLVCNPRYHMYYQGIKLYLFDHEMVRKLFRHSPKDYADFIVMLLFKRDLVNDYLTIDSTYRLIVRDEIIKKFKLDLNYDLILSNINNKTIDRIYYLIKKIYPDKIKNKINIQMIKKLFNIKYNSI